MYNTFCVETNRRLNCSLSKDGPPKYKKIFVDILYVISLNSYKLYQQDGGKSVLTHTCVLSIVHRRFTQGSYILE